MAEKTHDGRQRDALLVEVDGFGLRSMWQWTCSGIVGHLRVQLWLLA